MQKMVIHGDYDVDGILSTFLIYKYFKEKTDHEIIPIIPKRKDGYGLNAKSKSRITELKPHFLICCDCGINEDFNFLHPNTQITIFDHHQKDKEQPKAKVIHDTTRCTTDIVHNYFGFRSYRDLVAVASLADQMELKGKLLERVKIGITELANSKIPTFKTFYDHAYKPFGVLRSESLLFNLIPRLNASGRIDDPNKLLKYLIEENQFTYEYITRINGIRQDKTEIETSRAIANMKAINKARILITFSNLKSVNSIIASQLANKYKTLAIICHQDGKLVTGSVRTYHGNDIMTFFKKVQKNIPELIFGGHAGALGFRLEAKYFTKFVDILNIVIYREIKPADQYAETIVLNDITHIQHDLLQNEPYGRGKPEPIFKLENIELVNTRFTKKGHIMGECLDEKEETSYTIFLNKSLLDEHITIKSKLGDVLCFKSKPIKQIQFNLSWFLQQSRPCLNIKQFSV